jgi:uncharacterized membrane protein YhaH (DUF805 family)
MDNDTGTAPQPQMQQTTGVTQPVAPLQTPPQPPLTPPTKTNQNSSYVTSLFQGRLNRRNYWMGALLIFSVPAILILISAVTTALFPSQLILPPIDSGIPYTPPAPNPIERVVTSIAAVITMIYMLLLTPYIISLQIRRLHDLDQSGWLMLLCMVPPINAFFALYVSFFPGSVAENKFGTIPKQRVNIKEDILKLKAKPILV